mgnify:CR=1 FL=1
MIKTMQSQNAVVYAGVDVAKATHRSAKEIRVAQRAGEPHRRVADLHLVLDGTVDIEKQNPDRATIRAAVVIELRADGSNRTYYRLLCGNVSAIGAVGPDAEENRAFLSFSRAFRGIGLYVPAIFGEDAAADAQHFHRTESGITLVTRDMLRRL